MTDKTDALERVFCKEGHDSWGQWGHWYRDDAGGGVEYLRADLAAPKVRALHWQPISGCNMISGRCSLGAYTLLPLSDGTVRIYGIPGDSDHSATEPTIEAAKAAAQSDFEARVLACLETTKPAPDGTGCKPAGDGV